MIFGSWAARRAGMPGPAPQDLDLLIVGAPSALATSRAAAVVERSIGLPVHAVTVPAASWDAGDDALVEQIKRGPVVLVKDLWSVDV